MEMVQNMIGWRHIWQQELGCLTEEKVTATYVADSFVCLKHEVREPIELLGFPLHIGC